METNKSQESTFRKNPSISILALTDGRAGNAVMASGFAKKLANQLESPWQALACSPTRLIGLLPPSFWPIQNKICAATLLRHSAPKLITQLPAPDIIVSAGRRIAPIAAAYRRYRDAAGEKCTVIHLLNPQMRLDAFDFVIPPEHDGLNGKNILSSLGSLNGIEGKAQLETLQKHSDFMGFSAPRLGVLIGGQTKRWKMRPEDADALAQALINAAQHYQASIIGTVSRRTPPPLAKYIQTRLKDTLGDRVSLWLGEGQNPYFDILACADALIITTDSVNMACEAAATGKPVLTYPLGNMPKKIARLQTHLAQRGITKALEDFPDLNWHYPPLDEAQRIAELIAKLLTNERSASNPFHQ